METTARLAAIQQHLTAQLEDAGCVGPDEMGCTRDDDDKPLSEYCVNCLAGLLLMDFSTECEAKEQAEAKAARLQAALRDFGQHRDRCAVRRPRTMNIRLGMDFADTLPPADAQCDCGLMAALSASTDPE